jgi:hypothetical protein
MESAPARLASCEQDGDHRQCHEVRCDWVVSLFFYAGARALLVSHWAVDSDAAVGITTVAFEALASNPAIGKAEALRRSIEAAEWGAVHLFDLYGFLRR